MLTKNVNILNILSWQKKCGILPSVLTAVKDIPDEDMVLFLDELLHAIFRLLNEEQADHHSYALAALIHLLSLLSMENLFEVDPAFPYKGQKDRRVTCARKMFSEYKDSEPRRLAEIITGDETWIRYDEPLSKERNMVWIVKGEPPPLNPRPDF
ncbi:hypothetical protein LOD99_5315 [Oopsacas minuta]|uniref:Uncharacterized protein n=1 Tax=Oopsacas minuta TaxID=111878 RepID=A0AAV7JR31_9METZ|nr:hypothetical protein LOD99_5315 [Oopsacas minuta]